MTTTNTQPAAPANERNDAAALVARADRLEGENATLRAEVARLAEAASRADSTLSDRVSARLALIEQVRPFAGDKPLASLSERQLLEVGAARSDGSDDFLRGVIAVRAEGVQASAKVAATVQNTDSEDKPGPADEARAKFLASTRGFR